MQASGLQCKEQCRSTSRGDVFFLAFCLSKVIDLGSKIFARFFALKRTLQSCFKQKLPVDFRDHDHTIPYHEALSSPFSGE